MGSPVKMGDRHGAPVTGQGKAYSKMGGTGIYPQQGEKLDNDDYRNRKATSPQIGNNSGPRNPKINGIKNMKTGGQNRKSAGKVGFQKATGTT